MPPEDFCALILTHGRPDRQRTLSALKTSGYTGPVYLVLDDEDKSLPEYRKRYGDRVVTFSKSEIAPHFDMADNLPDRRGVIYARNASFGIAEGLGFKYFIMLDDDYTGFWFRSGPEQQFGHWQVRDLDQMLTAFLDYYRSTPATSICFAQGGDYIGGGASTSQRDVIFKRKAMNTFICSTDRRFTFDGRVNEDVNAYVSLGRRGHLFMTVMSVMVTQPMTQQNAGGMTELYLDGGTYVKSFYSVMLAPSCVKIGEVGNLHPRIHHHVNWPNAVPVILREQHRKPDRAAPTADAPKRARPRPARVPAAAAE